MSMARTSIMKTLTLVDRQGGELDLFVFEEEGRYLELLGGFIPLRGSFDSFQLLLGEQHVDDCAIKFNFSLLNTYRI